MSHSPRFCSFTPSFSRFNLASSRVCPAVGGRPRVAASRLRPGLAYLVLILAILLLSASASAQTATTNTLAVTSGGSAVTTITVGSVVTLTATVTAGSTPVAQGTVNFCDATAAHCTDIHVVGTAQLTSSGTAVFKIRPGIGSHSYKAVFFGTPNGATAYASSTSSAAALTVTGLWPSAAALTAVCNAPNFTATGVCSPASYAVTATVGGNASTAPTGTVSFLDASNGNSVQGTAPLGVGTAETSFLNVTNSELSTLGSSPSIAVGDFNGDGIPDLAVANIEAGTVTVMLGNGDGTFTTKSTPQTEREPSHLAVGDFNGDGILDLAVVNECGNIPINSDCVSGTLTILLGQGDGTFTAAATNPATGAAPTQIVAGDFNGDGILDLAVTNQCGPSPGSLNCTSGNVTILLGDGDGTFTPAASPPVGSAPASIAVGDFNGDGIPDLAVTNVCGNAPDSCSVDGTVTVLLGNGDGTFTATATSPATGTAPSFVVVGDFNEDGILDLAVVNACGSYEVCYSPSTATILLGNGDGTFTAAASPATGSDPVSIAVGDFNGDGIPDLAVANASSDNLTILLGNGDGTFLAAATIPAMGGGPWSVALGDFNGDGVTDLAVSIYSNIPDAGTLGTGVMAYLTAAYTATATGTVLLPSGTGANLVFASYAGDNNYTAGTSSATVLNPALITPTVTVTPSSFTVFTTLSETFTVTVGGGTGDPTPTGWVTLISSTYNSSAIALSGGSVRFVIPAGTLLIGSDTLTANYTPDTSSSTIYASASGTGTVLVISNSLATPTVVVTPASQNITPAQTLQVNVFVNAPSGDPTPTGLVMLTGGGYTSAATTLNSGNAQINVPAGSLAIGSDTLTVIYTPDASGSAVYNSASGISTVVVSPLTAPHLAFTTPPPANLTAGQGPGIVAVSVEDASNGVVTTSSATITLTVTGPNLYSQVYMATASTGVATFSSLASLSTVGSYSYTATDIPDGLTQAVAAESVIAPHLAFTTPPPTNLGAGKVPGTIVVSVENTNNNVIAASSATITLTVTGPSSYSKTYTAIASSGVATFSGLASFNVPGSYSYTATDTPDGFTQAVATENVTPQPPFGYLSPAVDSVTLSTTVSQSDSVEITGWVADPEDGVPMSNVTVYIDGGSAGAPTLGIARPAVAEAYGSADLNSGYQLLYPALSLSLGTHQVTVIAIDSGGRSTTFGPVTFTVATAAGPGSLIGDLGPAEDSVTFSTTVGQSDSVDISGWVFEPGVSVPLSNVTAYIDGGSVGTPTLGLARPAVASLYGSTYLNSGYQMLYPASSLSLGTHNVTVIASDSDGHSITLGPVTFTVAATAGAGSPFGELGPAVDSVTSSTTISQSDSVKISGWVFDPGKGVAMGSVTAYIDGTSIGTPTLGIARGGVAKDYGSSYLDSGYQMLYPASSLSLGAHTVTVIAIDSGGRSTTFGPVSFTVQ